MKEVRGIWLPDHEQHLLEYAKSDNWTYQKHKLDAALKLMRGRLHCVAVDVGGHCGLWSKEMVKVFGHVYAFEPIKEHRECFVRNVKAENYTLHPYALGKGPGFVSMFTREGSSGDSWCIPGTDVEMKTLDSFNLTPDFIKLDCEGGELFALMGAEETLKKYKPVICVEQKPGKAKNFGLGDTEAVTYLQSLGYKLGEVISGDYLLS